MKKPLIVSAAILVLACGVGSAWAQIAVTDGLTTARNAVVAALKRQIVDVVTAQRARLTNMARRLSASTNLDKYAAPPAPEWDSDHESAMAYAGSFRDALRGGDEAGIGFADVARTRVAAGDLIAGLPSHAQDTFERALATLDAADSSLIVGVHQVGRLWANGGHELRALTALESDVTDPSDAHSTTALLDKVSAAGLLETRQKQARLQYLMVLVEQLAIDNKRARDTEAAVLNMQLRRLLRTFGDEEGETGMLDGASDDLRTWRQP
jgi:hypothetical protein